MGFSSLFFSRPHCASFLASAALLVADAGDGILYVFCTFTTSQMPLRFSSVKGMGVPCIEELRWVCMVSLVMVVVVVVVGAGAGVVGGDEIGAPGLGVTDGTGIFMTSRSVVLS